MSNPLLAGNGLPPFSQIEAAHIVPAIQQVLNENRARLEEILGTAADSPSFERDILALEQLGDRLNRTWSPVSHLHGVVNSKALRAAYNECLPVLTGYATELAQDDRLYLLYQRVAEGLHECDAGAKRLLELALRDFRLAGVDLPATKKQAFKTRAEELSEAQARFEQNVLDAMGAWSFHEEDPTKLTGVPSTTLEQAAAQAKAADKRGWLFGLDQPTYIAITTHADNRELRQRFYRAWATRASAESEHKQFDNSDTIEQILKLRHETAQLVGFNNFAEYSLATKMAGSVEEVTEFLDELSLRSHAAARRELNELERFAGKGLAAWDIAYYSEKLRQERYAVSDEELRPFFPLSRVVVGLFQLVEKIYGLKLEVIEGVETWDPEVAYYQISNAQDEILGGFFTDFFARKSKRSGAWMDECINRKSIGGDHQHPVAHLVCNFAPPTESRPSLLNHDEVLTLFHEFGHTLHHVLTKVHYPSIAGINGVPWDAVELPSQFMENFAWESEVIEMISGHYETGEPLPAKLLGRLENSRSFQAAMQMARQLEFALFDLRLHAEYDPNRGSRLLPILESVRKRVAVVRYPEYNRFPHAFSHIFGGGYAAGYYSYKWAEVLAADAWSAFQENDIFDEQLAGRFRSEILEVGGSVDIADAFEAFRGRAASIEPLLLQSGIAMPGNG